MSGMRLGRGRLCDVSRCQDVFLWALVDDRRRRFRATESLRASRSRVLGPDAQGREASVHERHHPRSTAER